MLPSRLSPTAPLLLLLASLCPLSPTQAPQEETWTSPFGLPPGAAADALARIRSDTQPAVIPGSPWPAWDQRGGEGWGSPAVWLRWAELVRLEAAADSLDPGRRAQLALCARTQGRDRDAWDHLVSLADHPEFIAAILPAFVPGVSAGNCPGGEPSAGAAGCVEPGGLPGDLRSGDLLRPPLPPALDPKLFGTEAVLSAAIHQRALRVGDSLLAFELELLGDGVEVTLLHLSGPPAELFFVLPTPRGETIRSVYANWEKVPDASLPVGLRVSAEQPKGEIWGRFHASSTRWPEALPSGVDARIVEGEIRLVGDVDDPFLAAMAEGLGALLETTCPLVAPGTPAQGFREPLSIQLGSGPDEQAKLRGLLSRAEAYVLRQSAIASPAQDG